MSYILDALRRADAERERGRVPGLHTQATPLRTGDTAVSPPPARTRRPLAIALMVLVLLFAVAALAWWLPGDAPPDLAPASPRAAPEVAIANANAPAVAASPAPPVPPPQAMATPAPAPVLPILAAPAPPAPSPTAPKPPADATLPRVADLDPVARSTLPPLKISGATHADNPALRMLIVDGQVLQEGQDIAPGLRLESIGPRAAVINHQGRRMRLTY